MKRLLLLLELSLGIWLVLLPATGKAGMDVELGAAQGWGADFVPFKLEEGQRFVTTLRGNHDGVVGQPLVSTTLEARDGRVYLESEWKYVPVRRFLIYLENSIGEGTEWAVFENSERIPVDACFPDSCADLPVVIRGEWLQCDEVWIRLAKPDCACPGTNHCNELLVRLVPIDLPLTNAAVADSVELSLTGGPAGMPASLSIAKTYLKTMGYFHQTLGEATLKPGADGLTVANIGGTGMDGVSVKLDLLADFLGTPPVKGFGTAFSPVAIPDGGALTISTTGEFSSVSGLTSDVATVSHRDGALKVAADFSPIGAARMFVQVYSNGVLKGSVKLPGVGDAVTHVPDGTTEEPKLLSCGRLPPTLYSGYFLAWDRVAAWELPDGLKLTGDEIRLLPADGGSVDGPPQVQSLSSFEIFGTGLGEITLVSETILPQVLSIQSQQGDVIVSWSGKGTLQQASSPAGPWRDVTSTTDVESYREAALEASKFFRLRQ